MAQQFEQPQESGELRTQRMTADESRAVIDLWQQERVEQTGLTDKPAVPDVAEGLDITVEDVQRLLNEVRGRREEEARLLAQEQMLAEIRLAEEERKLAEVQRQRAELRQVQVSPLSQPAPRSRWVEVKPGVWEDAELAAIAASGPAPVRLVKVLFRIVFLSLLFISPFALLIYRISWAVSLMSR